jgi:hypothetical protein
VGLSERENQIGWKKLLDVPVAQRLFPERAVDPAGDRVADPDDDPEKENGKHKLKGVDHFATPVISL